MIPPVNTLVQLLLLRCGPQELPASRSLLTSAMLFHLAVGYLLSGLDVPAAQAFVVALLSTLLMVAVVHGLLSLHGHGNRTLQSVTGLAWAEGLLGLMLLPLFAFEGMGGVAALISLLILGWNIALAANIFRHALELERGIAFLYALAYLFVSMMVMGVVAPPAGAA